ncbi:hypothetical protein JCM8097_006537 [Rhodosporidiobolus ruineniae]
MASTEQQELLELLRSIPPLLSPDLPSPPPSPPPASTAHETASPHKRKAGELHPDHAGANGQARKRTVGLGLEGTEPHSDREDPPKRARPAPPPPPPAPSSSSSRQPPPPPPPALHAQPPTPELRGSPALGGTRAPPGPPPPAPNASGKSREKEEWRKDWPKERLRKLAAQCRDLGRSLKHKGDAFSRSASSSSAPPAPGAPAPSPRKDRLRGIVHQMDAILLYVFAFWCDDVAGRACVTANWQSVFGLIGFVKKAAEKEGGAGIVVGLCTRMEAIAVYTLSMHEQKALNYKGTQLSHALSSSSSASNGSSSSRAPPPPPPPPPDHLASPSSVTTDSPAAGSPSAAPMAAAASLSSSSSSSLPPSQAYSDFLRSFLRASPDLFRCQRLYDDSCALLSPSHLSTAFPRTWAAAAQPVNFDHPDVHEFVVPAGRPWRFAWPAELGRGTMGHQVAFARAVLEEWAEREGLGYEAARVGEGV